jgi:hypothetical protein
MKVPEELNPHEERMLAEARALHEARKRTAKQKAGHEEPSPPQPEKPLEEIVNKDDQGYISLDRLKKATRTSARTAAAILALWGANKLISAERSDSAPIPVIETVFTSTPEQEVVYDREQNMEIARELNVPAIYELISDAANIETIRHNSFFSMQCTPGDYSGPLHSNSWEDVYKESLAAESRHAAGVDSRTLLENKILSDLLRESYPDISREIYSLDSTKIADERVSTSARRRFEQFSDSLTTPQAPVSPGDLLIFLQTAGSQHSRKRALEVLFDMAQNNLMAPYGINPLDSTKIAVANQFGRAPELYLWIDAMAPVMTLLFNAAPDVMYEGDVEDTQRRLEAVNNFGSVLEPEYVYAVLMTETNGGKYIGDAPFISQNNSLYDLAPNGDRKWWFPTSEADMKQLSVFIEEEYGLPMNVPFERSAGVTRYPWQYIPGSLRRNFKSGGAIGAQALPIMQLHMKEKHDEARRRLYEQTGLLLPPMLFMSPTGMVETAYIYLGGYWRHIQADGNGHKSFAHFKGGALPGDPASARGAMKSWNPYRPQVEQVMSFYSRYANTTPAQTPNLRIYQRLKQQNQSGEIELAASF